MLTRPPGRSIRRTGAVLQSSRDMLLSVGGKELTPPQATPFALGERYEIALRRPDGSTVTPSLAIPKPKDKQRPLVVPDQVVTASRLDGGVGLIRVSMFPGILGMDVARDMSRAVTELGCDRLIFDLRGYTGGGIGCLRFMSLCAQTGEELVTPSGVPLPARATRRSACRHSIDFHRRSWA
jgi:C-terminal processing protease CtpA/Prc